MICPVCHGELREMQRSGVTVDVCPSCKGVWLDRGELEKIVEMETPGPMGGPAHCERGRGYESYRGDDDHDRGFDERHGTRRRRRGFFQGIFEALGGDD